MAVVFEGFSIREYASKMRSVNVSKCWPFDNEEKETTTTTKREILPPITCKKYRWWENELGEAMKSTIGINGDEENNNKGGRRGRKRKPVLQVTIPLTEKVSGIVKEIVPMDEEQQAVLGIEKPVLEDKPVSLSTPVLEDKPVLICPVCQIFTASTANAVNVHINSFCLAKSSRASREEEEQKNLSNNVLKKSKILKKRSIVEIFAVAPQIEMENEDEDDDDTGEEEEETKSKPKSKLKLKNKKKKKNKINGNGTGSAATKLNSKKERHQKKQEQGDAYDPICLSDMDSDDVWIIEKEDPSLPQNQSCMDSYECINVEENRRKVKRGTQDSDDAVDPIYLSDMESDDLWIIEKENPSLPQDPALKDIEGNFDDVEQAEERKRKRKMKEKVQELDLDEEIRHQNARASDLQIHSDE